MPVEIMGFKQFASAGDEMLVVANEEKAKQIAELRMLLQTEEAELKRKREAVKHMEAAKRCAILVICSFLLNDMPLCW